MGDFNVDLDTNDPNDLDKQQKVLEFLAANGELQSMVSQFRQQHRYAKMDNTTWYQPMEDGSWSKVGVEGSVDAFWVHRLLPQEQILVHSTTVCCAWVEGTSNVLLTDPVPFGSAILFIEAQCSHVHSWQMFAYLKSHDRSKMVFGSRAPSFLVKTNKLLRPDWSDFYKDVKNRSPMMPQNHGDRQWS